MRTATPGSAPASAPGVDCIEHGSLATDETIALMVEHGTFLVPTSYLSEGLDMSRAAPELKAKAAEVFPKARANAGESDPGRGEDRLRHRRSRRSRTARTPRNCGPWSTAA